MRPEYLLTADGMHAGEICGELMRGIRRASDIDLALRKWTLPIVVTIGDDLCRFSDVRNALGPVTPRAIALALKAMSESGWVRRTLIDDYPPTAGYALKPKARRILEIVRRLQSV